MTTDHTPTAAVPLAHLVYRSAAVSRFDSAALEDLLEQARRRNAALGITGLLVYDQGCFVQWLEGPAPAVDSVWRSIQRDPRHTEVERLHTAWRAGRLFPDWGMQYSAAQAAPRVRDDFFLASTRQRPGHPAADFGDEFIRGIALWQALPTPLAMADTLLAGREDDLQALTQAVCAHLPSIDMLGLHLLGPLARALGDSWCEDRCNSTELLLAQGRLQVLVRQVGLGLESAPPAAGRRVLVSMMPGETHMAGLSFAGVAFDCLGWQVLSAFPRSAGELTGLLQREVFDVLHLALSDSFVRAERHAELAALIRQARRVALNPMLQVLVSGRAFIEQPGLAAVVGADGDGLGQGSDSHDLALMLAWSRERAHSAGSMLAQAALDSLSLRLQRSRMGIAEEAVAKAPSLAAARPRALR